MSVMKDVKIKTGATTFETRDIGAEAQYIDVSLDSNGDIIEDITEPGVTVNTTESLTETLVGMKSDIDDKTELDMVGDAETIGGHPSRPYVEGEFLLGSDNNLYKVTEDIATTEDIEIDVNIESTTIAENLGKVTIIDSVPIENSGNPVASGGVYTAVEEAIENIDTRGDIIIISASYGATPAADNNFRTYLEPMLESVYKHIYSSTHGGDKFSDGSYLVQLQALASQVEDANKVVDILINDIGNDATATFSTVNTAMIAFKTYCKTTYPNAKVSLAPCTTRNDPNTKRLVFELYKYQLLHTTEHGIAMLTGMFNVMGKDYTFFVGSDGLHPNTEGAKIQASAIFNALTTGSFDLYCVGNEDFTAAHATASNISITGMGFMHWYKSNENCRVDVELEFTPSEDITFQTNWDIAKSLKLVETTQIQGFNVYWGEAMFNGVLINETSGEIVNVVMLSWYDNVAGKYFLHLFKAPYGTYTIKSGVQYKVVVKDTIPFTLV